MATPTPIQAEHTAFVAVLQRRNRRELGACGLVGCVFGGAALVVPTWPIALACVGNTLAAGLVAWQLHAHGRPQPMPAAEDASWRAYRAELERQAHLLATAPVWYVAPLAVGLAGLGLAAGVGAALPLGTLAAAGAVSAMVLAGVAWANVVASARLRARAASLSTGGDAGEDGAG